jgi:hypothetical protein
MDPVTTTTSPGPRRAGVRAGEETLHRRAHGSAGRGSCGTSASSSSWLRRPGLPGHDEVDSRQCRQRTSRSGPALMAPRAPTTRRSGRRVSAQVRKVERRGPPRPPGLWEASRIARRPPSSVRCQRPGQSTEPGPTRRRAPKLQTPAAGARGKGGRGRVPALVVALEVSSSGTPREVVPELLPHRDDPRPRSTPRRLADPASASAGIRPITTGRPGLMMPGLLGRDRLERVPSMLAVVHADRRDDAHLGLDDVGRVEPAAEADLDHAARRSAFLANCRNAIAVMNSKKLGRSSGPPSRAIPSATG